MVCWVTAAGVDVVGALMCVDVASSSTVISVTERIDSKNMINMMKNVIAW